MSKLLSDNLKTLMNTLAASAEVFLHHTFGERYTIVMLYTLLLAATVSLAGPLLAPETPAPLMPLFTVAFFVRLLLHLFDVWRRRRAGVHVQSHSSGISWSIWSELRLPAGVIHGLVEPLLCVAAAFLISRVDRVLSIWLCFAALAMMLKTMILRREAHEQMLDALDDRMSARNRHAALQRQTNPPLQGQNTPVAVNAPATPAPARPLAGLFRNLDPALQRLMQENQPGPTREPRPIHVWPANAKPQPATTRPTGTWGPAPPSTAPPPTPRVVFVRTRPAPAPEAPLRVTPAMPPGGFGRPREVSTTTASAERSGAVIPRQWPAAIPNRSEATPVPTPAEVRNPQATEASSPSLSATPSSATTTASETPIEATPSVSGRGEEHETLRERIREEATRLGFVVQTQSAADLTLTKGSVSLAVEIALNTKAARRFHNVKRCLESGVTRVAVVSPTPERLKAIAEAMHASLPLEEAMKVGYFGPQELMEELHRIARTSEKPARGVRRARAPQILANQTEHASQE